MASSAVNLASSRAHWLEPSRIGWHLAGDLQRIGWHLGEGLDWSFRLCWSAHGWPDPQALLGGSGTPLELESTALPEPWSQLQPHLRELAGFRLPRAAELDLRSVLKEALAVCAVDPSGSLRVATSVQIPTLLDQLYPGRQELGVLFEGPKPTLKLWAPTATRVRLLLFERAGDPLPRCSVELREDSLSGVWSVRGEPGWKNLFYLYEVEVWAPAVQKRVANQVTDPYSVSLSANGERSQIVDLDDPELMPPGWRELSKPPLASLADAVVYELHVRDFSIADTSVPAADRGGFRAFAAPGSRGRAHLAELAAAGVTHIQLLPVGDFSTVPERRRDQVLLEGFERCGPSSELPQQRISAVADLDGFAWGYDPLHFGVPEGSYASDPNGPARILELRELVAALSGLGLRVVLDVVYNHTAAAGQWPTSVLDRIVPGYYHRFDLDGQLATSACGANTATEHRRMAQLMLDTLLRWARAYKVDGFRFDLMGHHPLALMLEVRDALRTLTHEGDGVDGTRLLLLGEGWDFGEVAGNARFENACQKNLLGCGIATFSDRLRDAARGGGPFSDPAEPGFASGLGSYSRPEEAAASLLRLERAQALVELSLAGSLAPPGVRSVTEQLEIQPGLDLPEGFSATPLETVQYLECHDGETLFDALMLKLPPEVPLEERLRWHALGISLVALSQGIPFFHAGMELLRSKSGDRDSYQSGDWFNALDWSRRDNGWGRGLPPSAKNRSRWPLLRPLLARADLKPSPGQIERSYRQFLAWLRIRRSSPLFRLATAEEVLARVRFLSPGPQVAPGLIVQSIQDREGERDPRWQQVVVAWNAWRETRSVPAQNLGSLRFELHPELAGGGDGPCFDPRTVSFELPPLYCAVFVAPRDTPADQNRRVAPIV